MKLSFKRAALFAVVVAMLSFCLTDHTPRGTECHKSTSPDGVYIGERCLLNWVPGGNSEYVGRLCDAKSGKLLAQHTFSNPSHNIFGVPEHRIEIIVRWKIRNKKTGKIVDGAERGRYDTVWVSTATHGGTVFWQHNPDYLKATGGKSYR
ncbi:hypothetical protein [Trinickia mobilis]|uniref:hypothetical protein n=1 Tax=Trinickia mobilis TaxID=2816356 RepID=UPI001F5D9433|nr:hypothetical protein [Trinickia mobilis]